MNPLVYWIAGGVCLLVAVLILESRRQERKYGRSSGRGTAMMRAGMLEAQALLEPEKKVEILMQEEKTDFNFEVRSAGDPPPGNPAR